MSILDALRDRALFGPWFAAESWQAWYAFLAALFGLPLEGDALDAYRRHTGRTEPPTSPAREGWVIVGRRGGKSRIAALIAVYLACFRDYRGVLAPGEVGTVAVIAADRRQARTIMRYIVGFIDAVPMLAKMKAGGAKESISLTNRVVIEVHTANFRAVRGYTLVAVVADEIAFWRSEDTAANPDHEILAGLRPGLATVPGALLLAISSPYARRGALWDAHAKHYGRDGDPVLVWQGDTASMNSCVDPAVIAEAYAADEASAAAEFGAEFRRDIESFVSREVVNACVVPGRTDLPPTREHRFIAFTDPAGGSGTDSYTLAIAHAKGAGVVIDAIREVRPPFSPDQVTMDFAALLRAYNVTTVRGDRYAGEWPRERFRKYGVTYEVSEKPKSDIYGNALPLLTGTNIELPDHPRLIAQLVGLERRTARGGRDSIDHGPRGHDDLVNAVLGAAHTVKNRPRGGGNATRLQGI